MGDRFVQFPVCSFFFLCFSFVFIMMMMTGCKNTFMKKEDFKTLLLFFLFIVASHLLITSFIYTHHKKLPTI